MIELTNVNKSIGEKRILNNINLKLPSVGLVIIKGVNGSGKSTLLNLIGGIDKPSSGELKINNVDISRMSERELGKYREKNISFIFQDSNLFENMSVIDNINIVGNNGNVDNIMNFLGLSQLADKKVKKLSGGEKQRTAIARAINKNTEIVLCDEPTSSLDYNTKEPLFKYLKHLSQSKLVIVISHDDNLFYNYADIIIELNDGTIVNITENTTNNNSNNINSSTFQHENRFNNFKFLINNFFTNKKKLIFSSILLMISFVLILLSLSISSLDYKDIHRSSMSGENDNIIIFNKNELNTDNNIYERISEFEETDVKYLSENKITNTKLIIGKSINVDGSSMSFGIKYNIKNTVPYYQKYITKLSFLSTKDLKNEIYGNNPTLNNEIIISSYLADLMIEYGVMDKDKNYYYPENYEKLINDKKELILGSNNVTISGIYKMNLDKFKDLKKSYTSSLPKNIENIKDLFYDVLDNVAGNIYVKDEFFDLYTNIVPVVNSKYHFSLEEKNSYGAHTILDSQAIIFTDEIKLQDNSVLVKLEKNEIIVNREIIKQLGLDENNCVGQAITLYIYNIMSGSSDYVDKLTLTIKGISLDNDYYINQEAMQKFIDKEIYVSKIFVYENNDTILKKIFDKFPLENAEYTITTNYSQKIIGLIGFVSLSSKIFGIINIIFSILAIFLVINYFFNSIEIHKKDIAILKALGIKDKNIHSLFKNELIILMLSAYIVSIILFIIIGIILNNLVSSVLAIRTAIFSFNILHFIILLVSIFIIITIIFLFYNNKMKCE